MEIVNREKNDEKEGGNAFVAVVEGVVFDDEVEEVGGFFGDGGVEVLAVEGLHNGTERRFEGVVAWFAE